MPAPEWLAPESMPSEFCRWLPHAAPLSVFRPPSKNGSDRAHATEKTTDHSQQKRPSASSAYFELRCRQ